LTDGFVRSNLAVLALALTACTGQAPPPDKPKIEEKPEVEVHSELPKAKDGGVQTMTQENVRKAFEPEATIQGADSRRCGKWRDRIVLTRPNDKGSYDLRIRPDTGDLEVDCAWEGPVLVETRVKGEVVGVVWPHVVTYAPGARRTGRIQVVQGTTGGITAEAVDASKPHYDRQLVIGFHVPEEFDVQREGDEPCANAIERHWQEVLADLEASGGFHEKMSKETPHCPPEAVERFCDTFAFLFPHELVLTDSQARPAGGEVGCAHLPK